MTDPIQAATAVTQGGLSGLFEEDGLRTRGEKAGELPSEVWRGDMKASYGCRHGDLLHASPYLDRYSVAGSALPRLSRSCLALVILIILIISRDDSISS